MVWKCKNVNEYQRNIQINGIWKGYTYNGINGIQTVYGSGSDDIG